MKPVSAECGALDLVAHVHLVSAMKDGSMYFCKEGLCKHLPVIIIASCCNFQQFLQPEIGKLVECVVSQNNTYLVPSIDDGQLVAR